MLKKIFVQNADLNFKLLLFFYLFLKVFLKNLFKDVMLRKNILIDI